MVNIWKEFNFFNIICKYCSLYMIEYINTIYYETVIVLYICKNELDNI